AANTFTGRVVSKDSFELRDDAEGGGLNINVTTGGRIYFAPWYNGAYNFQREFGFDPAVEKWYAEGGFTDASLTQSSVTQHQAALSIAWSQLTSLPDYATRWPSWSEVSDKPSTFSPSAHTHSASDITSGTLSDARLPATIGGNKTFSNNVAV